MDNYNPPSRASMHRDYRTAQLDAPPDLRTVQLALVKELLQTLKNVEYTLEETGTCPLATSTLRKMSKLSTMVCTRPSGRAGHLQSNVTKLTRFEYAPLLGWGTTPGNSYTAKDNEPARWEEALAHNAPETRGGVT